MKRNFAHYGVSLCSLLLVGALYAQEPAANVRFGVSAPLRDIVDFNPIPADPSNEVYEIPNILQIEPNAVDLKVQKNVPAIRSEVRGIGGAATPDILLSADTYTAQNNIALFGGTSLPPDTNGDIGINFYITYVNTGWIISNRDGSVADGPFPGNTFWTGFGGPCETNNAGDPIVLYDKQADRWVFSQFTSSANPDGRQCFAISQTNDPLGPYFLYEFVFPGVFNDYPHIGVWTDETAPGNGSRSGYYFVTHDFSDVGGPNQAFEQASFVAVERDAMLAGDPNPGFERITDTTIQGLSGFGALPPHLESIQTVAAGTCAPFIQARPDLQGFLISDMCVDWDAGTSSLENIRVIDAGETWAPGPGNVVQPGGTAANALDTLASTGRVLYRASYRANDAASGLPDTYVVVSPVDVGAGQAGFRWAQIDFVTDEDILVGGFEEGELSFPGRGGAIVNQGEYAPDSTVDRWMPAISVDRDGNLGVAYTASSDLTAPVIFPSVHVTSRKSSDPANTLRDEQVCVAGGGIQTSTSGRWGDYSSVSVDPVDECTFWGLVEYQPTTANADWANRVCTFKFDDCGEPGARFDTNVNNTVSVCSADSDIVGFDYRLIGLNDIAETVNLSVNGLPGGTSASFSESAMINTFPNNGRVTITGLSGVPTDEYALILQGDSASVDASLIYSVSLSDAPVTSQSTLLQPANTASDVDLLPEFSWTALPDATGYLFELATDIDFNNVVISRQLEGTTFSLGASLEASTDYFWRVTGINNCGGTTASLVSTFTTGSFVSGTAADCPMGTSANVVFFDDIESGMNGWTLPPDPTAGGSNTWTQSTERAFAGTSWMATDLPVSSDQYLVSPVITLPSAAQAPISLAYWNFQNMEANTGTGVDACWDGGLLEVSSNGGPFVQIAESSVLRDPYNGTVTNNDASAISDLFAWCADDAQAASGEQTDFAVIDLNAFAGQSVQFRFRLGTDGAVGDEGWYIDNVTVQGCQ